MSYIMNDLPTLQDDLGWSAELTRLSSRIAACPTPHVLGIHGDWGSGKTSFMRQLQYSLGGKIDDSAAVQGAAAKTDATHTTSAGETVDKKEERIAKEKLRLSHQKQIMTIWFDAWRYQNEPSLVVALLQEMRRQMPNLPAFIAKGKKFTEIAMTSVLDSLGQIAKLISFEALPDVAKIENRGAQWEREHHAQILATNSIHEHLKQAFASLLPKGDTTRIVIFIDDLDRCNPKAAMRLLEGLKIYLSIEKCVFVLGMNEGVLVDAIAEEFSSLKTASNAELALRAGHYLEKICSDIYRLPLPSSNAQLFADWVEANLKRSAQLPLTNISLQKQALLRALGDRQVLPPNPRRIKALVNQWERFATCVPIPDTANDDDEDRTDWAARTYIVTYIHQFNRDIWERWRFNRDFWLEIVKWCKTPAKGGSNEPRDWSHALKPGFQRALSETEGAESTSFPNPGDQTIFWLSQMVLDSALDLNANKFEAYLKQKP